MASASTLRATDRVSLRKLRHADEDLPIPKSNGKKQSNGKKRLVPKPRRRAAKS